MRKIFLIPLMTLCTCVMAYAEGHASYQEGDVAEMKVVIGTETTTTYFATLQDAFDNLPQNSYPATVKVLANTTPEYTRQSLVINQYQNVTLDLNGKQVNCNANNTKGSELINNKGTLTIIDSSDGQNGVISNNAVNPDASAEQGAVVGYATNVIKNRGSLYVNGGTIECTVTTVGASYCIDMYENWEKDLVTPNYVEINGGTLRNEANPCIRVCGYNGANQTLVINGGKLTSQRRTIWCQQQTKNVSKYATQNVTITINGGELEVGPGYTYGSRNFAIMAEADDSNDWHCLTININGGTIKGDIAMDASDTWNGTWNGIDGNTDKLAKVNITGGHFEINTHPYNSVHTGAFFYRMCDRKGINCPQKGITGGIFASNPNVVTNIVCDYGNGGGETAEETATAMKAWGYYIADGYVAHLIESGDDAGKWEVIPATQAAVTTDETWTDATDHSTDAVTVKSGAEVVIAEDQTVEVHSLDIQDEGQMIVKDGATLIIGNGGLVSTNNTMTQIVVEAGGTVAIGNGGIEQQGTATPVEIQSDGDKSGVLLIDPNAPAEVAEALAEVTVYTHAYKSGDIEHWQQLATPVKGNGMSIIPLGVGQLDGVYTSIYGWDYSSDSWVRVPGMPEGSGDVTYFGKAGWSGNNILTPFAAYNLINNRLPNEEAIAYTFKGKLVGNDDMILNFPANGFCVFGNSYTAPIDLTTLFAQIQNDMASTNIDPCVYVYNSIADRFESVNAGGLWLKSIGFGDVAFTQIPAQQAFVMNLLGGGSAQSAVDYAKCVWGNTNTNKNVPIMAPKQVENTLSAVLNINVTDGVSSDRVVLMEDDQFSDAYDKGYDAEKYMNGSFNIYAIAERNLAMVASDNIENTELTFAAGNAVNYTMTFGKTMGDFVLVDRANNSQVAIEEGGIYTFAAQPNYTAEARFAIVPAAKMPTAIENTEVKSNVKGIYTITGQYMGENFNVLPAGVYVIDGVKIVK